MLVIMSHAYFNADTAIYKKGLIVYVLNARHCLYYYEMDDFLWHIQTHSHTSPGVPYRWDTINKKWNYLLTCMTDFQHLTNYYLYHKALYKAYTRVRYTLILIDTSTSYMRHVHIFHITCSIYVWICAIYNIYIYFNKICQHRMWCV